MIEQTTGEYLNTTFYLVTIWGGGGVELAFFPNWLVEIFQNRTPPLLMHFLPFFFFFDS